MTNMCTDTKTLDIVGVTTGTLAAIFATITVIMLGAHMDAANFPGSNLNLAKYTTDGRYKDVDLDGQNVAVLNGYIVDATPGCNNFVHGVGGRDPANFNVCVANTETSADNVPTLDKTELLEWTGWIVAPDCIRSETDPSMCAIFGAYSGLSYCGQITFALLAIQTILFTAHSCIALKNQALKVAQKALGLKIVSVRALLKSSDKTTKTILGLTITWGIITTCLFIASMFAFQSFCDKIDTGLGRKVKYGAKKPGDTVQKGVVACATTGCVSDYWTFFTLFVSSFLFFGIPNLLISFGFLDVARRPETETETNDDSELKSFM
jgi:hypothetical protein